jgi:hypothetical protein
VVNLAWAFNPNLVLTRLPVTLTIFMVPLEPRPVRSFLTLTRDFRLRGKQVVDTMNDPERVRNDSIRGCGAEVVGGKPAKDLVRDTGRGLSGYLQCGAIGDARTVEVRGLDVPSLANSRTDCAEITRIPNAELPLAAL